MQIAPTKNLNHIIVLIKQIYTVMKMRITALAVKRVSVSVRLIYEAST